MTDAERIMNTFNQNVTGCRWRQSSRPQLAYEPGCYYIHCEHDKCVCAMNDGDGGPVSEFIARWEKRNGRTKP